MTENQKLREALHKAKAALSLALSDVDWRKDSLTQPVIHKAYNCAHEALAMPTADHLPDAGEMVEAAAPVGERLTLPAEDVHAAFVKHFPKTRISQAWIGFAAEIAEAIAARAALSAGDAVDSQRYRWLMDNCTLGIKQNGVGWSLNTSACVAPDCIKDVGAAIDAAMRKDKP